MHEQVVELHYTSQQAQRLDKFLVANLPEFSRSRLQALIKQKLVQVNGLPAYKSGQLLEGFAVVTVHLPPPEPTHLVAESIPLNIIYENEDLIVVNKPAGMVVHPSAGHSVGTLVNAALAHATDINGVGESRRPGVVHRLDKDTSGLILLSKNDSAHHWLQNQFRNRQVEKSYLALVDGAPPTPRGRVEVAISRDPAHRQRMAVVPEGRGRSAVSDYQTKQAFSTHTLLEIHPITGRTHQIRLHLAFLGCPVVGDRLYGRRHPSLPIQRQFLHAYRLRIHLPGMKELSSFEAPLPYDLSSLLASLPTK